MQYVMNKYLLDTNICVHFLRGKYNIIDKIREVGFDNCCISEITYAELLCGVKLALSRKQNYKPQPLETFLANIDILPISDVIELFADEKVRLRLTGLPVGDDFDLLIGCTAVYYEMTLVTENIKHFKNIEDIDIENWVKREDK